MTRELINRMLIDKQDLAHFIQAFVNYLPDVAADQRGHTPGSKECCGLCVHSSLPGIGYT